jgi:hypothetical protein
MFELEKIMNSVDPRVNQKSQKATVDKFINNLNESQILSIKYNLPSPILANALLQNIACTHASIYIAGNYQKV